MVSITKSIEFTNQEASMLLNMIDVAVKTAGLQAAEGAIHLARKINAAFAESVPTQPATPAVKTEEPVQTSDAPAT